jgi:hypothetical protein
MTMGERDWIGTLVIPTIMALGPALVVALVANYFITRWQRHSQRLSKIADLQDEVYRRARTVFVQMVHAPDDAFAELYAASALGRSPEEVSLEDDAIEATLEAVRQYNASRRDLAEIANDVQRLFSSATHAAASDAAGAVLRYYQETHRAILQAAGIPEAASGTLSTLKVEAIIKVRSALMRLASEIGENPTTPGRESKPGEPAFGQRADDLPPELTEIEWRFNLDPQGRDRRCTDAVWRAVLKRTTVNKKGA